VIFIMKRIKLLLFWVLIVVTTGTSLAAIEKIQYTDYALDNVSGAPLTGVHNIRISYFKPDLAHTF